MSSSSAGMVIVLLLIGLLLVAFWRQVVAFLLASVLMVFLYGLMEVMTRINQH